MLRSLALASALVVASLSASALSAQSSAATTKPSPSAPSHAPTVHAKVDSGSTSAMNKSTSKSMKWTTDQIKEAQEGLAKAGFYKGKPTGVFNADTKKALKSYQKKNKLPVTGRLDNEVLNKLKSA
jgi:peptidoglycan hydrolase-like protein with peptidoglycan-binding domain